MLENLRKSMLQDIPNAHLFDHLSSIYDIGRQSFGDAMRLVEHFRCVPEIIAFSNQLSYDGKIRPLREANSTDLKPACVACRVAGHPRRRHSTTVEARRIIDTIKAMIRHPRYAGKTIGVISLLGEAQALLIQSLLHKESTAHRDRAVAVFRPASRASSRATSATSSSSRWSTARPTKGRSAPPATGAFELIKKRYNVAASRARDQLWVVHSFDPDQ
jgi:hypothetical protein